MDANDYKLIVRAFDGPLTPVEQQKLTLLLRISPEAKRAHAELRALRNAVADEAALAFAPGFADRVMDRVAPKPHTRPAIQGRLYALPQHSYRWAVAAALALLVGIGVTWWLQPVTVSAPHGATATVDFPDGSTATLASGSHLSYPRRFGAEGRQVRLTGEGFFAVEHADTPFIVETFNAAVEVKGTRFNVRAWAEEAEAQTVVTLETGRVEVRALAAASPTVALAPGEATSVRADTTAPRPAAAIPLDRALAWRTGGLAFVNQPLSVVFEELERRYAVEINPRFANINSYRLTYIDAQPGTLEAVLSDVCHTRNLRYRRTAQGFEIIAG